MLLDCKQGLEASAASSFDYRQIHTFGKRKMPIVGDTSSMPSLKLSRSGNLTGMVQHDGICCSSIFRSGRPTSVMSSPLGPHPEEAALFARPSRRMAAGTNSPVAVLRDARILRQAQERAPQDEAD